jgi:hypothetical protein
MKLPRPTGWKLWAWISASAAWTVFYLFFARPGPGLADGTFNGGVTVMFNWLFPVALIYLALTIGRRR